MKRQLAIFIFKIIPTSFLSRIFGYLALISLPNFKMKFIVRWYCNKFGVNLDEYIVPENGFKNLDSFFTRKIKPEKRKIDDTKNSIVSPVDGRIDSFGKITNGKLIQAKGIDYTLESLLPSDTAKDFQDGFFITIYLSPGDYHRMHSPVAGKIYGYFNLPGKLLTVQEFMVKGLKGLFSKNERIFSYIKTNHGKVAFCKVGAMNVGKITLSYNKEKTNKWIRRKQETFFESKDEIAIEKGEEIAIFHMGSTVILLFQKNKIEFTQIKMGQKIKLGEKIAFFK